MANPLQVLFDACDLLAKNENDEQTQTVLSEQLIGKPTESKGKAPIIPQSNGKAKESKGKTPLHKPRMTHLKDGPKRGRKKAKETCTELIIFGGVPPEISDDGNYPKPIGKPKESKGKAPLIPQPNGTAKESKGNAPLLKPRMTRLKDGPKRWRKETQENCNKLIIFRGVPPEISDDGNYPKFDSLGRRSRRQPPMKLEVTEESEALKRKFDEFKERKNLERARSGVLHTKADRKILDKFPLSPPPPCHPLEKSDERTIKEAWTTQELESLWIGVRKFGHNIWEAKGRSPRDLSDQWEKEMSNLLNKASPDSIMVSTSGKDHDIRSSSSRQDIDLNKPRVFDSEEEDD